MKKIVLSVMVVILSISAVKSQDYKTGLGFRGGWFWGLTVKHFFKQDVAGEFLLTGYRTGYYSGYLFTGLIEKHYEAFDEDGLKWYFGGGFHVGQWQYETVINKVDASFNVGIDGILGMEYTFQQAPINISLDWKPAFSFTANSGLWVDGFAVSVRYTIK